LVGDGDGDGEVREEFVSRDWGSGKGGEVRGGRGMGEGGGGGEEGSVFGRSSRGLMDGGSVGKRQMLGNNTAINIRSGSKRSIGGKGIQTVRN
jgi:hypothetical protein